MAPPAGFVGIPRKKSSSGLGVNWIEQGAEVLAMALKQNGTIRRPIYNQLFGPMPTAKRRGASSDPELWHRKGLGQMCL